MKKREEAVAAYNFVKKTVRYGFPRWVDPETTMNTRKGHCAAQSELLVWLLRKRGIEARYVEGRNPSLRPLPAMRLKMMNVHFWVEAKIGNEWLCLDPSPDSGALRLWGDTKPGTHLGDPEYVTRLNELPPWYRDAYNSFLSGHSGY